MSSLARGVLGILVVLAQPACFLFDDCGDEGADDYDEALLQQAEDDLDCKRGDIAYAFVRNPGQMLTGRAQGCSKVANYDCTSTSGSCGSTCSLRGPVGLQ